MAIPSLAAPGVQSYQRRFVCGFRASAALQALGAIGNDLVKVKDANSRRNMVVQLSEAQLDWRRSKVTVWASRQAIDGTIRFLREQTGLAELLARLHEEMNTHAQRR